MLLIGHVSRNVRSTDYERPVSVLQAFFATGCIIDRESDFSPEIYLVRRSGVVFAFKSSYTLVQAV